MAVLGAGMILASCIGIGGCVEQQEQKPQEKIAEIIAASAMYKYEQRHTFSDAEKQTEIKIESAANEYESAQVIIWANEQAVEYYDLTVSDLVSKSGKTIDKSNISVYSAFYNSVSNSQNGYPSGYVPDVLIPLNDRIKYGDNKVALGENQSLWITVYVPKGTEAGDYTSNFRVTINNASYDVPVTLTVYPFELPDETHVKSAFAIWGPTYGNDMLTNLYGSKAMAAENVYYEFLLKYRVAPTSLPNLDLSSAQSWVDQAVEYAKRADVPSFSLPFKINANKYDFWFDEQYMHDVLSVLVDNCTEEANVFDKLYAYGVVDEPDYNKQFNKARDFTSTMKSIVETVLAEKDAEGAFEGKPSVREGLKNLQTIITLNKWGPHIYDGTLGDDVTAYCPLFYQFDVQENLKGFAEMQAKNVGIWAYGANVPGWPYPTYQIDADMVSPRSVGAFQMRFNVEGNLFWCANVSRVFNGSLYTENWDPYKTHYVFAKWPGDGFVVAPAGRYNARSIRPYGTMRLEMIREGQEDYEYLYLLKQLVAKKGESALSELEQKLEVEYAKILDGAKPTEDAEKMIAFKKTIASMIIENL